MSAQPTDPLICIAEQSRQAEGVARQMPHRRVEQLVHRCVTALSDETANEGQRLCAVAHAFHMAPRTLRRWRQQQRSQAPAILRGRPRKQSPPSKRRNVLELLQREGAHVGMPSLRAAFPDMPRCELGELQADYRKYYRSTHKKRVRRLAWHKAGAVWATDHVVPPNPIDGVNTAVLAVRDLATGQQLAWQPVPDQTSPIAETVLQSLIDRYGPPLVLKSDNGSAFISKNFSAMLDAFSIAWLPSPPRSPWYNGGCEAGNGSLRTRTDHFAEPDGVWTSASLARAQKQANELTRPLGFLGPTPNQRWAEREPITAQQRAAFLTAVCRCRRDILAEEKDRLNLQNKNHKRKLQRQAVKRALLDCGLLTMTERLIPPPLRRKKAAKIS